MKTDIIELCAYFAFTAFVTLMAFVNPKVLEYLRIISKTPAWDDYNPPTSEIEEIEIEIEVEEIEEIEVTPPNIIEEAIGGVCSLGFSKTESKKVVNRVCNSRVFTDTEELIKATLDKSNV
tara:strand:- start:289 stop:651 length:363 start_codon:yes stop_codon:yes gene_type:complete